MHSMTIAESLEKTLFMSTPAVAMIIILSVLLFACNPSFIPFFQQQKFLNVISNAKIKIFLHVDGTSDLI